MKLIIFISLVLLLFTINASVAQEPEWWEKMKQIKLLSDTREDVLKILGNPVDNEIENYVWYHNFPEGRVTIMYQNIPDHCVNKPDTEGKIKRWQVPKWTVIEVAFEPKELVDPKRLNINLDRMEGFIATPVYDVAESIEYFNEDLGIYYTTLQGKIQDITFVPAKKFNYSKCK